jgi:hypothetical protein
MADTTQPLSTAWDRASKPTAAWKDLRQRAHTDEERACVAAASRQADRVWIALHTGRLRVGNAAAFVPPRNAEWHRLALSAYEVLRESTAYGHLAQLRPWACAAVEPIIAAWLRGPAAVQSGSGGNSGAGQVTVAQHLGVGDAVDLINADTQVAHLSTLLNAAQEAAVFGVPRHRVELVTTTEAHDASPVVRVVVDTPDGLAFASEPLELEVLVDPEATGVGAATAALRRVADVATGLFDSHARMMWQSPPSMPTLDQSAHPTGRAFPELNLHEQAAHPMPPTPAPEPSHAIAPQTVPRDPNPTGRPR